MICTISWGKLILTTLLPSTGKSTEASINTCFFYGDSHAVVTPHSFSIQKWNNVSCCRQLRSPVEIWHLGPCRERQHVLLHVLIRNVHAILCAILMLWKSFPKVMRHWWTWDAPSNVPNPGKEETKKGANPPSSSQTTRILARNYNGSEWHLPRQPTISCPCTTVFRSRGGWKENMNQWKKPGLISNTTNTMATMPKTTTITTKRRILPPTCFHHLNTMMSWWQY